MLRSPAGPLDDTVSAKGPITVRQLLDFTFGFGMMLEMFMVEEPWPVVKRATDLNLGTLGPPDRPRAVRAGGGVRSRSCARRR